ncbi:MAG: tetratricopeptide repeat protein [Acidobacteriota bacterium]|nr:tetratricopeptide repeat protein [Acidobacteriota bacterium]
MLLAWTAPLYSGQTEERQCLASAFPLLQQHMLSDAEAKLSDCQRQYPQSAILNNALGIVYEQEGRKEDATKAFKKALALLPSFTAAQIHLGTLYANAGNCDPAKRLLNTAAVSTSDSGALVASGIGLGQCHDLAGSIRALEKALQSNPQSLSAAYNLALARYQNNEAKASLEMLNSLPESAKDADILFLKGKVGQALRRSSPPTERITDTAIAALLSDACRARVQEDYCTQAALEFIHQEQFADAAGVLENALQTAPASVAMLSALGLARFRLGRYTEAIDAYSKAIQLDPSLEAAREGLGFLLYMTGDLERARSVVEAGLHNSESESYLRYLRALILYRQSPDLRPEALASVTAAIDKNPKFAPAYFLRGKIQSDRNDPADALKDFQSAIRIDPKYSLPYYRMARIYSTMGRTSEAAEAARQFSLLGSLREDDVLAGQAKARLTPEPDR